MNTYKDKRKEVINMRTERIKIKYDRYRNVYVIEGAEEIYEETEQAEATSRVLSGSSDDGYCAEYVGHGKVGSIPVLARYLLSEEDMMSDDDNEIEDESDYDWEHALENGRIEIDIDQLSVDAWEILQVMSIAQANS